MWQPSSNVPRVERVQDPTSADALVLDRLRELGCDPMRPHRVRHFLYLPAQAAADTVAAQLELDGWRTSVASEDDVWLVVASCVRVLTDPRVRSTRAWLERLVGPHGGAYDGWEVDRD